MNFIAGSWLSVSHRVVGHRSQLYDPAEDPGTCLTVPGNPARPNPANPLTTGAISLKLSHTSQCQLLGYLVSESLESIFV